MTFNTMKFYLISVSIKKFIPSFDNKHRCTWKKTTYKYLKFKKNEDKMYNLEKIRSTDTMMLVPAPLTCMYQR